MRYTFGNTDNAAVRLQNTAGFFNPLAGKFILLYLKKPIYAAADLGCGTSFATQALALYQLKRSCLLKSPKLIELATYYSLCSLFASLLNTVIQLFIFATYIHRVLNKKHKATFLTASWNMKRIILTK